MSNREDITLLLTAADEAIDTLLRPIMLEAVIAQKDQALFAQLCAFVGMTHVLRAMLDADLMPSGDVITDAFKLEMNKFIGMVRNVSDRARGWSA